MYKIVDQVTADCLQKGDIVFVHDADTDGMVYMIIEDTADEMDIRIYGFNVDDDETEYDLTYEADTLMDVYMDIDDDDDSV